MTNTTKQNYLKNFLNNEERVNSKDMVAPPVPSESSQAGFARIKAIFEQDAPHFQAEVSKSSGKQFKHEVKLPGVIHTTTRKNNVGGGLNELNLKKEANSAVSEPNAAKKKKVTFANPEISDNVTESQPTLTEYMMQKEREVQESNPFKTMRETMPVCENVNAFDNAFEQDNHQKSSDLHQAQATVDDMLFGGKSSDRFKVHPLLYIDIDGYVAPDKRDPNLERCKVTHSGRKIEPKIERKHGFQSDPSIKHIKVDTAVCSITKGNDKIERKHGFQSDPSIKHTKVDTAVCSITKGNDKKGVRLDASYEQEPLSEVSKVNVKELANRFRG